MSGNTHRVPRLRGTGLESDAELAALVRASNQLAVAVEARTPLGSGKGRVRRLDNGYLLGGERGGAGGGGGELPPFWAVGGKGRVRVGWGLVYGVAALPRVPFMNGVDLRERPVLEVGSLGWVVLRVRFELVWREVVPEPRDVHVGYTHVPAEGGGPGFCRLDYESVTDPPYEVLDSYEVLSGASGVEVEWMTGGWPEAQVNAGDTQLVVNVVVARVENDQVRSVLRNDVNVTLRVNSLSPPIFPERPRAEVSFRGWQQGRQPGDLE